MPWCVEGHTWAAVGCSGWAAVGAEGALRTVNAASTAPARAMTAAPVNAVVTVLALAAVSGGYETAREAADVRAYPMPGQLIDVGDHRLHLSCTGSGSPTAVLEPGAGNASASLGWVTPAVASQTRVCVYDRAGRGWSDPATTTTQDATQIATDLHTLLQRGHVPGPYVLAGHSFGGLYVLTYAASYPDDAARLVLIDSTAPAARPGTPPAGSAGSSGSQAASPR